jgi:anti-sigma factor RsiW
MKEHDSTNLTCQEVVELVTEFLGDTLDPKERVRLEQHLLVCPPCTLHVAQMKATIDFTALLRTEPPPGDVNQELLERFRAWSRK